MITRRQISDAHSLIAPHLRLTPIIDVSGMSPLPLTLKLEVFQHTGSFKPRGAFNNLLSLDRPSAGVAAASGGNHGAAVAYAAAQLQSKARIFVPLTTPPAKLALIRAEGADIVQKGGNYAEAFDLCRRYVEETGALLVHAYDSALTIAGQGTLALELERQAPDLDTILVAVGGGGLIAGVAAWYSSGLKIVSVEPENCPTLERALSHSGPVDIAPSGVAADSLGASRIGALPFSLAKSYVDRALLVADSDIRRAQAWLWNNLRLIAEPGGATAFAAITSGAYRPGPQERVGIVVCGANTDLASFAEAAGLDALTPAEAFAPSP
ncbi:MAG TPA: threonine/serine dehydratase [Aestuariivirgaceae bacterium]|jgi:threonine dehydratase